MVYNGPSKACGTCRRRRIKCDEAQPKCQTCSRRGLQCDGYDELFARRHRDQSDSTRLRSQRAKLKQESRTLTIQMPRVVCLSKITDIVDPCKVGPQASKYDLQILAVASTVPTFVREPFETAACQVFLSTYCDSSPDAQVTGGFMQHLQPMLMKISLDSPLYSAVTAVSTTFAVLLSRGSDHWSLPTKYYAAATRALRTAIAQEHRTRDDDLLMTALILNFCDSININFASLQGRGKRSHQLGALALAQHRGEANYKNEAGKAMVMSLRDSILHNALHNKTIVPESCQSLSAHSDLLRRPTTQLDDLSTTLANVLSTAAALCANGCNSSPVFSEVIEKLTILDGRFAAWYEGLPERFAPRVLSDLQIPASIRKAGVYRGTCSVYIGLSLAHLFNLWRHRRMMLLHQLRRLLLSCGGPQIEEEIKNIEEKLQWLADGICESVPFFLGDYTDKTPSIMNANITFPTFCIGGSKFPLCMRDHAKRAAASGSWLMVSPLTNIIELADERSGVHPLTLRVGQLEWVKGQLVRLHDQGNGICGCQDDSTLRPRAALPCVILRQLQGSK